MPDDDTPVPVPTEADVTHEGDGDGDHEVPADLVEIHEALDYLERVNRGPNPQP